ncbi:MAG TPA: DoxX family protein [Gemmatimonadaceae bacterium]|nr:DoxX family protein [Gemmatimonadaceae bacterium]
MTMDTFARILQLFAGLGLLNVWLVRARSATSYRGGRAQTLRQEFDTYGLPAGAFYIVGTLKIVAGVILLASLWLPMPARLAATVVAVLMIGALLMHAKAKDPVRKSVPAAVMLSMCVGIVALL